MQVISQSSNSASPADLGIRQACAVYFKNYVDKFWMKREEIGSTEKFSISQVDREFIQLHLVEAIVNAPPSIRSQLLTCVNRIIRYEFPSGFQIVNEQALHLLQSSDSNAVSAGLLVTLEIIKYRSSSSDKNLELHLSTFMPQLLRIGQQAIGPLSSVQTSTPEVHAILKAVAKCFFVAIRYKFSKHLLSNSGNFVPWCTLLMQILQAPIPSEDLKAKDSDDSFTLDKTLFWKMKKWTYRAQNRIASRYGCVEEAKSLGKEETAFSKVYSENFSEAVMNVNLSVIQASMNGEAPLTDKTCNLLTEYLTVCVKGKKTWKSIRPHIQLIISHFLFPKICFTESDEELWSDDPQEFLKTVFFSFDDYDSINQSCSGLILDIVKARKKETFPMVLSFINSVMESYASQPNSITAQRQKDGALYLMGNLSKVMLTSQIKNDLEPFLTAHVVPDLLSSQKFLRLRAAWCIEQFESMQWSNLDSSSKMISGLMKCLEDSELPVRAQACVTIGSLLDQDLCQQQLTPHLGKIVQITLQLTNQVELDSLSYVMDRLVSMFPNELSPYAEELTIQLRTSFLNLLESSLTRDEEHAGDIIGSNDYYFNDTDKMMAAVALLETLETVISQMCSIPETCARVEQALIPLFMVVLQRRLSDILSETVSLIESITYKRKEISMEMWQMFNELLKILSPDSLPEFLPDCSTTLENFVSYGAPVLLQTPEYLPKLFAIIDYTLAVAEDGGYDSLSDKMAAIDMIESILLYCRGHIDQVIPHVLDLMGNQLLRNRKDQDEEMSKTLLIRSIEVVLNCLYYSASISLNHLHRQGWLNVFLTLWSTNLEGFKRVHDHRLILLSLASIFHVSIESLPEEVSSSLPGLLSIFLNSVQTYPKALEEREKLKKEFEAEELEFNSGAQKQFDEQLEDEEEEKDDAGVEEFDQDEDLDLEDEDEEESYEDDDWEDSDELEEDLFFECPLDSLDYSQLVRSTLIDLSKKPVWNQLTSKLTPEQGTILQQII